MDAERAPDVYRAMWCPNEWTPTGALATWDVRGRLNEIDVPTLVVRGRYDMSTAALSRTLVDGIANSQLVEFEASSHTPVLQESDRYLAVVSAFMRAHDEGGKMMVP